MDEEVYEAKDRGARERVHQEEERAQRGVEEEGDRAITTLAARAIAAAAVVRATEAKCQRVLEGRRCGKRPAVACGRCGVVLCEEYKHGLNDCGEGRQEERRPQADDPEGEGGAERGEQEGEQQQGVDEVMGGGEEGPPEVVTQVPEEGTQGWREEGKAEEEGVEGQDPFEEVDFGVPTDDEDEGAQGMERQQGEEPPQAEEKQQEGEEEGARGDEGRAGEVNQPAEQIQEVRGGERRRRGTEDSVPSAGWNTPRHDPSSPPQHDHVHGGPLE